MTELSTPRLALRQWRDSDLEPFASLNADARVMELMPRSLSREESDAFARAAQAELARLGFGLWAIELRQGAQFIGCVGLRAVSFEAHFVPAIEISWRLAAPSWGNGYASEAARECMSFAFGSLGLTEVVSFTVPHNVRSRAVMVRLGMRHDAHGDFDHPRLPPGHPLRRHVLYRLARSDWRRA